MKRLDAHAGRVVGDARLLVVVAIHPAPRPTSTGRRTARPSWRAPWRARPGACSRCRTRARRPAAWSWRRRRPSAPGRARADRRSGRASSASSTRALDPSGELDPLGAVAGRRRPGRRNGTDDEAAGAGRRRWCPTNLVHVATVHARGTDETGAVASVDRGCATLSWVFRMALVVGAGALLLTAVHRSRSRRACGGSPTPTRRRRSSCPTSRALAARSTVYDVAGNEIAVYEVENSQPIALGDVPQHVIDAFLAVEDTEFYLHHGVNVRSLIRATLSNFASDAPAQGASTITMQVVKNDYMAGLPPRRPVQAPADHVRGAAREAEDEGPDPRALPQHRLLRPELVRHRRRGRDVLRQARRRPHVHRGGVPRRAGAGTVELRPDQPPRAQPSPLQPGARPVGGGRRSSPGATRRRAHRLRAARAGQAPRGTGDHPHLLQRGAARLPAEPERHPRRDVRGALHACCTAAACSIHTTLDPNLQARAEEARNQLPDNPLGIDAAITSIETTRVRSGRWSAARASSPASAR